MEHQIIGNGIHQMVLDSLLKEEDLQDKIGLQAYHTADGLGAIQQMQQQDTYLATEQPILVMDIHMSESLVVGRLTGILNLSLVVLH
jgi:CheY-like chemotaxis protein